MRCVRALPLGIILLLIPSWISYLLIDERDDFDTENPLYFHVPDITQDPVQLVIALLITPVINTEGDQILLVTGLLVAFGTFVEKRLGTWRMFAIFWGTTTSGALLGGLLLHVLYPLFPDIEIFHTGWRRVFNGGSAGGFGLVGCLRRHLEPLVDRGGPLRGVGADLLGDHLPGLHIGLPRHCIRHRLPHGAPIPAPAGRYDRGFGRTNRPNMPERSPIATGTTNPRNVPIQTGVSNRHEADHGSAGSRVDRSRGCAVVRARAVLDDDGIFIARAT